MIYITGDTHGSIDIKKFEKLRGRVTAADYVIICGDFGVYWDESPFLQVYGDHPEVLPNQYLKEFYESFPCTFLWIDGNHENFNLIKHLPHQMKFNNYVHSCWSNCYHLMRGKVYNIDGISFFTMGGADSIDRHLRKAYIDWWPEEFPTTEEMERGIFSLDAAGKIDFILTHDAPISWMTEYYNCPYTNSLNKYFEHIYRNYNYDYWFFGHHHVDEDFPDERLQAVYNDFAVIENKNGAITITHSLNNMQ